MPRKSPGLSWIDLTSISPDVRPTRSRKSGGRFPPHPLMFRIVAAAGQAFFDPRRKAIRETRVQDNVADFMTQSGACGRSRDVVSHMLWNLRSG